MVQDGGAIGESRGVEFTAIVAQQALVANANEEGIRRLLLILIDNALKHTPPGGVVGVCAMPDDSGVILEVHDSGSGIPEDALPHVFERFYRADPSHEGPGA